MSNLGIIVHNALAFCTADVSLSIGCSSQKVILQKDKFAAFTYFDAVGVVLVCIYVLNNFIHWCSRPI